jgi:hypothetical protein
MLVDHEHACVNASQMQNIVQNGGKRDKKQPIFDLRGISTNWFKNLLCLSISRLRARPDREKATVRKSMNLSFCAMQTMPLFAKIVSIAKGGAAFWPSHCMQPSHNQPRM